jgi:cytochrome c oxidase subunit 4
MTMLSAFGAWLTLLVLVAAEVAAALVAGSGLAAAGIGVTAAVLVAMTFMRLPSAPRLGAVFAVAGVFWLAVLLGLGGIDPATRQRTQVELRTPSGTPDLPPPLSLAR